MKDPTYIKIFFEKLIGGEEWLKKCLLEPKLGGHGADPWAIEVGIAGKPIMFSFKFRKERLECCINLRVLQNGAGFTKLIKEHYGERFDEFDVRIVTRDGDSYFKPFGSKSRNGVRSQKTQDVFFLIGNPPELNKKERVSQCHEMPDGGNISLRDAVIRVLKRLGHGPERVLSHDLRF